VSLSGSFRLVGTGMGTTSGSNIHLTGSVWKPPTQSSRFRSVVLRADCSSAERVGCAGVPEVLCTPIDTPAETGYAPVDRLKEWRHVLAPCPRFPDSRSLPQAPKPMAAILLDTKVKWAHTRCSS